MKKAEQKGRKRPKNLEEQIDVLTETRSKLLEQVEELTAGKVLLEENLRVKDEFFNRAFGMLVEISTNLPGYTAQVPFDIHNTEDKLNVLIKKIKEQAMNLKDSLKEERERRESIVIEIKSAAEVITEEISLPENPVGMLERIKRKVKKLKSDLNERLESETTKELLTTIIMAIKEE